MSAGRVTHCMNIWSFSLLDKYSTMPQYCCVPECKNKKSKHVFPKNETIKHKWHPAEIRRLDPVTKKLWTPGPNDRAYSDHFQPHDFKKTQTDMVWQYESLATPVKYVYCRCFLFVVKQFAKHCKYMFLKCPFGFTVLCSWSENMRIWGKFVTELKQLSSEGLTGNKT